jgi:hypothetical protein
VVAVSSQNVHHSTWHVWRLQHLNKQQQQSVIVWLNWAALGAVKECVLSG